MLNIANTLNISLPPRPRPPRSIDRLIFVCFGFSGAAALMYEIIWTRSLSTIMGSSTYAMSTMLAAFMAGLSLGGLIGAKLTARVRRIPLLFALSELGIGLFGLLIVPLIGALTPLFIMSYYAFHLSFDAFLFVQFLISFLIMGIPTTLMGMTFPAVIKHFAHGAKDVGDVSGRLYSINTLGAIAGSLAAGFVLIPLIGARESALVAAACNILIALAILILMGERRKALAAAALASIMMGLFVASDKTHASLFSYYTAPRMGSYASAMAVYKHERNTDDGVLLYSYDGAAGRVEVARSLSPDSPSPYILINGGKLEGGDDAGFALLGYLPPATRPAENPRGRALSIGLGSGTTLSALAAFPLPAIVSVELNPGVMEASRRFYHPELFDDPRIQHVAADGRRYLLLALEKYEYIVVSPSWAVETSSAAFLTEEFFSLAASKLTRGGVFALWLDYFLMSPEDMEVVLRTLSRSFPHVRAWSVRDTSGIIITASRSPFPSTPYEVMRTVSALRPELTGALMPVFEEEDVRRIPPGLINTDNRPVIEFRNARNAILGPDSTVPAEQPHAAAPAHTPKVPAS